MANLYINGFWVNDIEARTDNWGKNVESWADLSITMTRNSNKYSRKNYGFLFSNNIKKEYKGLEKSLKDHSLFRIFLKDFGFIEDDKSDFEFDYQMFIASERKYKDPFIYLNQKQLDKNSLPVPKQIKNVVIVAKVKDIYKQKFKEKWRKNSVSLFFTVKNDSGWELTRLEFNNFQYLEPNTDDKTKFYNLDNVFVSDDYEEKQKTSLTLLSNLKENILPNEETNNSNKIDFYLFREIFNSLRNFYSNSLSLGKSNNYNQQDDFSNNYDTLFNYGIKDFIEELKTKKDEIASNLSKYSYFVLKTNIEKKIGDKIRNLTLFDHSDTSDDWNIDITIKDKIENPKKLTTVLDDKIKKLISEIDIIRSTIEKNNKEISNQNKELKELNEKKQVKEEYWKNNCKQINESNKYLDMDLQKLDFEDINIDNKIKEILQFIKKQDNWNSLELENFETENNKTIKELEDKSKKLDDTIATEKMKFESLKNKINNLKKEARKPNAIAEKNVEITKNIKQNESENEKIKKNLDVLDSYKKKLQKSLVQNRKKFIEKCIEAVKDNISPIKEKYESMPDVNKDINIIEKNINTKKKENSFHNDSIENKENETEILKNQIKETIEKFDEWTKNKQHLYFIELKRSKPQSQENKKENKTPLKIPSNFKDPNTCLNITNINIGTKMIVDRYYNAIKNSVEGYYKNPYSIYGLINPPVIPKSILSESNSLNLLSKIIKKYSLNNEQEKNIRKMLLTNSIYYLQGPPGTGKTRVISAMCEHLIKNELQNVLITSSTHEAIVNCLDEVDKNNQSDPNFIIYKKQRKTDIRPNKYSAQSLFHNFIIKSFNNFLQENGETKEKNDEINRYKEISEDLDQLTKTLKNENHDLKLLMWLFSDQAEEKFVKEHENKKCSSFVENYSEYQKKYPFLRDDLLIGNITSPFFLQENKLENGRKIVEEIKKYKNLSTFLKDMAENEKKLFLSTDSLSKYLKSKLSIKNKSNPKVKILKNFIEFKKNEDEKNRNNQDENTNEFLNFDSNNQDDLLYMDDSKWSFEFINYANENNLINLIGLTTTSRTTLDLDESNNKDILLDYPIDVTIMDEVSKSSTPEILTRLLVSDKFIMCGDYKQLPPSEYIPEDDIKKVLKNSFDKINNELRTKEIDDNKPRHLIHRLLKRKEVISNNDWEQNKNNWYKQLKDFINAPIFKNQILEIKNKKYSSNNEPVYGFFTEQHRTNEVIMKLINCFYDNDEKLRMPQVHNNLNEIIKFNNASNKLHFIDTTIQPESFITKYVKKTESKSLDFKGEIPRIGVFENELFKKIETQSTYNLYNALVVINILIELRNNNSFDKLKKKIGVISMTRTQTNLIRLLIGQCQELKGLKIDTNTIDNFQGREKEIIIVDFVRNKDYCIFHEVSENKIVVTKRRDVEFLTNDERNNVAASRSKNVLFMVGAFKYYKTINSDFLLKKYSNYGEEEQNESKWTDGSAIYGKHKD
ncbi:AAA family ATPase [Mycoplasma zalophidermidis]|uniref:AAA family ATPase n=1 Tax=Mycoplasma zalophidermidis TaxID=398174 RepID=A0ABS6DRR3_9MOLU|nr:AAA domain-containing protein [Mycoplasma zalophidermidis]MBU4693700.1 AAA family ATPase [Mycoplasma zalophidermidis]